MYRGRLLDTAYSTSSYFPIVVQYLDWCYDDYERSVFTVILFDIV